MAKEEYLHRRVEEDDGRVHWRLINGDGEYNRITIELTLGRYEDLRRSEALLEAVEEYGFDLNLIMDVEYLERYNLISEHIQRLKCDDQMIEEKMSHAKRVYDFTAEDMVQLTKDTLRVNALWEWIENDLDPNCVPDFWISEKDE